MKLIRKNELTLKEYILMIYGAQLGTGILTLPRALAEKAGTDGWMVIPVCFVFSTLSSICFVKISQKFPNYTFKEILVKLFGKIIGNIIILSYIIYFIIYTWIILIYGMLYIKGALLPKTPDYLIIILFLIPTFIIVRGKINLVGIYCELIFYMSICIILLFLVPLKSGNLLHIMPLFKRDILTILSALPIMVFPFTGFEIIAFMHPYLKKKNYAIRGVVIANSITMTIYLFITMICFLCFSPDEIIFYNQPVLTILKIIEVSFLERFDLIIVTLYLFIVFTSWTSYTYITLLGYSQMFKKTKLLYPTLCLFFLFIMLTYIIHPSWEQTDKFKWFITKIAIITAYLMPVLLLAVINIRRKLFSK
ncbi:TPA: endospore germination permease [Bacillus cereus]